MLVQTDEAFLTYYNNKVPGWKRIYQDHLIQDRSLNRVVKSIGSFISTYNLDPKRLTDSIIDFYYDKNKRYPHIFLFKGPLALTIYKNYRLGHVIDLTETQRISVSVKKSKILLKSLLKNGIIYNKGVYSLQITGKADPYFLLAHGIKDGVSKQSIKKWEEDNVIKKLVLDIIFS
jgi:hypothetical protein